MELQKAALAYVTCYCGLRHGMPHEVFPCEEVTMAVIFVLMGRIATTAQASSRSTLLVDGSLYIDLYMQA